jgi:hypothetical protein
MLSYLRDTTLVQYLSIDFTTAVRRADGTLPISKCGTFIVTPVLAHRRRPVPIPLMDPRVRREDKGLAADL